MAYCRYCGAEILSSDTFCNKCGRSLAIQSTDSVPSDAGTEKVSTIGTVSDAKVRMDVIIDPARIIVLSILSFGLYFFYWFYLTWKHYRDYTRTENYPIWHALTLFVPIYYLFRAHAHIRSFKELMAEKSMPSNLRPGLFVVLVAISAILNTISWRIYLYDPSFNTIILDIFTIIFDIVILVWVQTNLNRFWRTIKDISVNNARIGVGEVIFVLFGIWSWMELL